LMSKKSGQAHSVPPTSLFLQPLCSSNLSVPPTSLFLQPLCSSNLSVPPPTSDLSVEPSRFAAILALGMLVGS
jgi:hypothetical protein